MTLQLRILTSCVRFCFWISGRNHAFAFEYEGEERKKPITSGIAIFTGSTVLYTIVLFGAGCIFDIKYLPLIYLYGIMMNIQTLVGYLAEPMEKMRYIPHLVWSALL